MTPINGSGLFIRGIVILMAFCLFGSFLPNHAGSVLQKAAGVPSSQVFVPADDPNIQYMGRIDFSEPKKPRFWSPGVTIRVKFRGPSCGLLIDDQVLYGNTHNYIEIVVDDSKPYRIQTKSKHDTIWVRAGMVAEKSGTPGNLTAEEHELRFCKDTESGIGYLEFQGLICGGLLPSSPPASHKIEFIGNSITCGSGIDVSEIPCGKGKWYDQHNAWLSYGPLTARALNAQWHITAVSGIGLMHSCCNMGNIIMPRVFDKIDQRDDSISWDFSRYIPDVVTICLGQNDGIQDSTVFCGNYIRFIEHIRGYYPAAQIVCLTSPMADARLDAVLKNYLGGITDHFNRSGDGRIHAYFYSKRYFHGCGTHPDMDEHREIAGELSSYLKKIMGW
jgi:lysophospholipase L1-like esterase